MTPAEIPPNNPSDSPLKPLLPTAGLWCTRVYGVWITIMFSLLASGILLCSDLPKGYQAYDYSLYCYDILTTWLHEHFPPGSPDPSLVSFGSSHLGWALRINDLAHSLGYPDQNGINASTPSLTNKSIPALLDDAGPLLVRGKLWMINVEDYWFTQQHTPGVSGLKEQVLRQVPFFLLLNDIGNAQRLTWMESSRIMPKRYMTGTVLDPSGEWLSLKNTRIGSMKKLDDLVVRSSIHRYYDNLVFHPGAIDDLNVLSTMAKAHHIPVVVIITPRISHWNRLTDEMIGHVKHPARQAIDTWVRQNNFTLIDCRGVDYPCGVNDGEFSDPVHLNRQGARDFTVYLSHRLRAFAAKKPQ